MASFYRGGRVDLYYNESVKFQTASYGTLTTGECRADNFQVLRL